MNGPSAGVHNIYLQTWLNYGFFGLLAYLGIWVVFFLKSLRASRRGSRFGYENAVLWGVMAGAAGLMVAGVFENNFRDGEVQTAALLLISLALFELKKQSSPLFSKK